MRKTSRADSRQLDKVILACFVLFKRIACDQRLLEAFQVDLIKTFASFLSNEELVLSCIDSPNTEFLLNSRDSEDEMDELI